MRKHFILVYIKKISTAVELIRNGDLDDFVAAVSDLYRKNISTPRNGFRYFVLFPIAILEEIHLLLDERAFAYPLRGGNWQVIQLPSFSFDRRIPVLTRSIRNTRHGSPKHTELMEEIYSFEGFVTVEQNDIVVDVGAFVGTFSFCFADRADTLISIEPNASTNNILNYNLRSYSNVIVVPKAAWQEQTELEIHQSALPNENSVLTPDQKQLDKSFYVDADTVPGLVRNYGVDHIDYLKIEAEGAEPEILEGALADGMMIEKIAVDASAERDGNNIIDKIGAILDSYGYEWRVKEVAPGWGSNIVFAKK